MEQMGLIRRANLGKEFFLELSNSVLLSNTQSSATPVPAGCPPNTAPSLIRPQAQEPWSAVPFKAQHALPTNCYSVDQYSSFCPKPPKQQIHCSLQCCQKILLSEESPSSKILHVYVHASRYLQLFVVYMGKWSQGQMHVDFQAMLRCLTY